MFEIVRMLPTIVLASIVFRSVNQPPENPSSRGWLAAFLAGATIVLGMGFSQIR